MMMLADYDAVEFTEGIPIPEAYNARVTYEINGARTLDFQYPSNEKSSLVRENKIVICEGQAYRIMRVSSIKDGRELLDVKCTHVFNADAPCTHIQKMPDMMGAYPTAVIGAAISGTKFSLLSDYELSLRGMRRVDDDGFMIDFFSVDKTNPYDVIKTVIESCGKGELYADNYKIALVERIGKDTNVRLDLSKNMCDMSIERDITDIVTRLYPYGRDDMHIGSVNNGVQYIESGNAALYGVRSGYRDYSDCVEADALLRRAMWEFDNENPERIDVPCVNITGTYAEISKLAEYGGYEELHIGDGVTVIDGGDEIGERVVKIEYFPYEGESAVISVGRVKKDMFFYLEQMGTLVNRYKKSSTPSGQVKGSSVSGTITNSGISITNTGGSLSILSDIIRIFNNGTEKLRVGNDNGGFVCRVADNVTVNQLTIGGNILTTDGNGNLILNGEILRGEN